MLASKDKALIEIDRATVRFGTMAVLDDINITLHSGEIVCLVGGNGAGKTTLLHALLGFVPIACGAIRIAGIDVGTQPEQARGQCALVPEQAVLYSNLSGLENLEYFLRLSGHTGLRREDLLATLERVGLDAAVAGKKAGGYSKGMRQKVVLALALARGACVLLLDEPSSGLDPASIEDLNAALENARAQGAAILVVTHDLGQASAIGNRIAFLRRGQLAQVMAREEFAGSDLAVAYARVARAVA